MAAEQTEPLRLVLLFTYRMSLAVWKQQGLVDREIGYYRFMRDAGLTDLHALTYGANDAQLAGDVAPFHVLPPPTGAGPLRHSLLAPFKQRAVFDAADIIKSNQSRGAWTGIVAKLRRRSTKFVVRCGFVRTEQIMRHDERRTGLNLWYTKAIERLTFAVADAVIVTSSADKRFLENTYGTNGAKIWIIPNSVDDALFAPGPMTGALHEPLRILAIGRVVKMKNFQSIIEAAATLGCPVEVTIIGDGQHRRALEALAAERRVSVNFIESVRNDNLPEYLRATDIFIMPQLFGSGMSKVILEAMACGALTIASNIDAHREVIRDGENGCLTEPDPESLAKTLERVRAMTAAERLAMTRQARTDIETRYSMRANAARETEGYRQLLGRGPARPMGSASS